METTSVSTHESRISLCSRSRDRATAVKLNIAHRSSRDLAGTSDRGRTARIPQITLSFLLEPQTSSVCVARLNGAQPTETRNIGIALSRAKSSPGTLSVDLASERDFEESNEKSILTVHHR